MTPDRDAPVYTVSELNRLARGLLEMRLGELWLTGEITNLARPASGHLYFTLKDERAQLRCAMFRNRNLRLRFRPTDGMAVRAFGKVSLYEARGEFQFIVETLEPAGAGALQQAFEALKQRLHAEGLFAAEHKRPLPPFPRRLGVITSPAGAAIRDVLQVLRRRWPLLEVIVYPASVQGEAAPGELRAALATAIERNEVDLLLLTRGGGSLEDLWAFNDEALARAIHACPLPVVSAVGHEIDFTIADFVADLRAPTPSAAAELITPDRSELAATLRQLADRLRQGERRRRQALGQRLAWLQRHLAAHHPARQVQQRMLRCDELARRLLSAWQHQQLLRAQRLARWQARLQRHHPRERLQRRRERLGHLHQRLQGAIHRRLGDHGQHLGRLQQALQLLGPQATLARGYAILTDPGGCRIHRSVAELPPGTPFRARLHDGTLAARSEAPPAPEDGAAS